MWRTLLVKLLACFPDKDRQSGFSTVGVVVAAGITMIGLTASMSMLDNRKTYLEILRMQNQTDMLELRLSSAGRSMSALAISAEKAGPGSDLYRCIVGQQCSSSLTFQPFDLYNAGGQRLSGKRLLNGGPCDGECPIAVQTEFAVNCGTGSSCTTPAEILTRYRVLKASAKYFGNREFKTRQGQVSVATFVCDEDEYVVGITSDGVIRCEKAIASRFTASCPAGTAAFGLSDKGLLKCSPVIDYCAEPLAFSYVLDTSGSMKSGGKIAAAKGSAVGFIDKLKNGDNGTLTTFNSTAKLNKGLSGDFNGLKSDVRGLKAGGRTNMSAGLKVAGDSLIGFKNGQKVAVFLSDGHHNTGDVNPVDQAKILKDAGIRIFSVGYGKSPDRNLLMQVASSPADYFDVQKAGDLQGMFNQLSEVVCRNK